MTQQNPFEDPRIRYGIGATGAILVAFIAYSYLDGTAQLVAYAIAVLDLLVTPRILKRAATT